MPAERRRLLFEAAGALACAWWRVRFRPFQSYSERLGAPQSGRAEAVRPGDLDAARDVAWAIGIVNRLFAGRATCLVQGMAAKAMLNRRGVANTLVLGARLDGDGPERQPDGMAAHAWLTVDEETLLGGDVRHDYVPLTSYHSPGRMEV